MARLLDEFSHFNQRAEAEIAAKGFDDMVGRLDEQRSKQPMQNMALA